MTKIPRITLKAARINAGFTIEQACKKFGVSHGTLIKWEKNPGNLTPNQQKKIEEIYGFPCDYIFFGDGLEFNSIQMKKGDFNEPDITN